MKRIENAEAVYREKQFTMAKSVCELDSSISEEFKDEKTLIRIRAEIFCEKASHKGIIVGKNGESLKKIGSYAREDMEAFFGQKVYINLWGKVKEKWRDSASSDIRVALALPSAE